MSKWRRKLPRSVEEVSRGNATFSFVFFEYSNIYNINMHVQCSTVDVSGFRTPPPPSSPLENSNFLNSQRKFTAKRPWIPSLPNKLNNLWTPPPHHHQPGQNSGSAHKLSLDLRMQLISVHNAAFGGGMYNKRSLLSIRTKY